MIIVPPETSQEYFPLIPQFYDSRTIKNRSGVRESFCSCDDNRKGCSFAGVCYFAVCVRMRILRAVGLFGAQNKRASFTRTACDDWRQNERDGTFAGRVAVQAR